MSSSDLTAVGARRSIGVPIQAVLRDWTALSLIRSVLFIDLDAVQGDGTVPAVAFEAGASRPVLLQEELGRTSLSTVRFCAISLVDEPDGPIEEAKAVAVVSAIRDAVPTARIVQAHVIAGSPSEDWTTRMPALLGWHNLALSPEESQAPDKGASPLTRSSSDPRWLFSLVGTLCSLLGLWPGQSKGVLDDRRPPAGGSIIPVRSYVRSIAAGAVEQGVAQRLFAFDEHYPAPRVESGTAVVVDDEAAAATEMADAVLAKYPDVMPRKRVFPPAPPTEQIGFLKALKQFFGFMLNALKNAPRAMAESLVRSVSAGVARSVQNIVFGGADSAFQVVARGVRADGSPASWTEYEHSLDDVLRRSAPGGEVGAPEQNPALWSDYVDAALTLLDAGSRKHDLDYRTSGSQRAIVATTSRVAPSPADKFRLPPQLAAFLTSWEVEPGDDINAGRLFDELGRRLGNQGHLAVDVRNEQQRLREWGLRSRNSYIGHVGRRLGDAYRNLTSELAALERKIQDLTTAAGMPDEIGKQQEALARRLRILAVIAIVTVIALGVLAGLGYLTLLIGGTAILVVLVGWVFGSTVTYMKGQQKLYQFLNRQRQRATDLETALRHRIEALEDLRRISRAYRQYLDWTRALSAFVHAPLGNPATTDVKSLVVGQGLPRSIGVGVALPDHDVLDEIANQWRRELFPVGWLQEAWREFFNDVPATLGALRHRIQTEQELLLQDRAIDREGSVLTRWSRAVAENAEDRPSSQTFLKHLQQLTESDAQARDRLLSRVMTRDSSTGAAREQARRAFDEGLDRDYSAIPLSFLAGMFSPYAMAIDVRSVKDHVLQVQHRGLDSATVLVQFGGAYSPDQFHSLETPAAPAQTPAAVPAQPPTVQSAPYSVHYGTPAGLDRDWI